MAKWSKPLALVAVLVAVAVAVLVGRSPRRASPAAATEAGVVATGSSDGGPPLRETFRSPIALLGGVDVGGLDRSPTLRGNVVSAADGAAIPGAEVVMLDQVASISAISGPRGEIEIEAPREGRFVLASVRKDGFVSLEPSASEGGVVWDAKAGRAIEGIVLTLEPSLQIAGVIRDPDGQPAVGALVTVTDGARHEPIATLTAGAKGDFRFEAPLGAVVRATDRRFSAVYALVDPRVLLARRLALRFRRLAGERAVLRGRVVDEADRPLEGALVSLEERNAEPRDEAARELGTSDAEGRFSFEVARGVGYTLDASLAGRARASLPEVSAPGAEPVLRLGAGGTLRGRVTGPKGVPASFSVVVWERIGELGLVARAEGSFLGGAGEFTLGGLAAGRYAARAVASGLGPSSRADFTIDAPGGDASVELALLRGARLHGRITSEATKKPIASARINVEGTLGPGGAAAVASARSNDDGRFELLGMSAGLGSLLVTADGHHSRILSGIATKEGEDIGPVDVALAAVAKGEEPKLELVGIGAVLSTTDDALRVVEAFPESGAAQAGIAPGDEVVAVDDRPVKELGFDGAIQAIRGVEGTTVTLIVRRAGAEPAPVVVKRSRMRR